VLTLLIPLVEVTAFSKRTQSNYLGHALSL
jgi:hypothetical protein